MKRIWTMTACLAALGTLATLTLVPAGEAEASHDGLVGAWRVSVVIPGVSFPAYQTFHLDRTLTERNSFSGDSQSTGVWKRLRSRGNYAFTFEGFDFDLEFGFFTGHHQVRGEIQVTGDTLAGTITALSFDREGNRIGPLRMATFTGNRMIVVP